MKKIIALISFLLIINQSFAQSFQVKIVPKIKKDSLYIAYVLSYPSYPSTAPTVGNIQMVVKIDENAVDLDKGRIVKTSRYDITDPNSKNHFRAAELRHPTTDRSAYIIMRNPSNTLSPYNLQNVNFDTLGIIAYPLLTCTERFSIDFDDQGSVQTIIRSWDLAQDFSKIINLVNYQGVVPREKAPLTLSQDKICDGANLNISTSAKGTGYVLNIYRNGAVVNRNKTSSTPSFTNVVAGKDFLNGDAFVISFRNAVGCVDSTVSKRITVGDCCDSTFTQMAPSYCISSFKVKLIPATPGGIFRGAGVVFNTILNVWVFNPSIAGAGTHKITYTLGLTSLDCAGKSSSQTVVVNAAPCVATVADGLATVTVPKPAGIYTNCNGEIFVTSSDRGLVFKIDTFGVKSVYAGDSASVFPKDGDIYSALNKPKFCAPVGIVGNNRGDIFITDQATHAVIKIDVSGLTTTIGGWPRLGLYQCFSTNYKEGYVNGSIGTSRFFTPFGLALSPSEDTLYVSEIGNRRIRGIELKSGLYNTFDVAGNGVAGSTNGNASAATFRSPQHMSVSGNYLYVADAGSNMIRRIDLNAKKVITLAGKPGPVSSNVGVDTSLAKLVNPSSATADCEGNVYVVESANNWILRVNQLANSMTVTKFAGTGDEGKIDSSNALYSTFKAPQAASIFSKGFIDIADQGNDLIRRVAIYDWTDNAFNGLDTVYCLKGPKDTLVPLQCGGEMFCDNCGPNILSVVPTGSGRNRYAFNPIDTGTFVLRYRYTSGKCVQTLTKTVKVVNPKKPDLGTDLSFCDQVLKINLKNAPFLSYDWRRDNATVVVPVVQDYISVNQMLTNYSDITVSTIDENGCPGKDTLRIAKASATFPNVTLEHAGSDTLCKGEIVTLFAKFPSTSDEAKFYTSWNTNNPVDNGLFVQATGSYKYVFTIADKNSPTCTKSYEKSLYVKDAPRGCYKLTNNVTGNEIDLERYSVSTLVNTPGNLKKPMDVVYRGGYLYIADGENNKIKRYNFKTKLLEDFIGNGIDGATDSLAPLQTQLNFPSSIAFDGNGDLLICNLAGNYISKYDVAKNKVYIVAGNPGKIGLNDGEGINSRFNKPTHLEVDNHGNVFVTDNLNNAIRMLIPIANKPYYKVVTYTGFSGIQGNVDGKPKVAQFDYPWGIAMSNEGLVISEDLNHTIRKINFDTVASVYSGKFKTADNLPPVDELELNALDARYNKPWGITVDPQGQVYIADGFNNNIKRIGKDGNVVTIAGLGPNDSGSQDGDTYIATFNRPTALALDPDSKTIYVTDRDNGSIRVIKRDTVLVCDSDFENNMTYVNQCLKTTTTSKWYFSDEKVKDSLIVSTTAEGGVSISKPGLYVNELTEKLSSGCSNVFRDSLRIKPKGKFAIKTNLALGIDQSAINKYCLDQPLELKITTVPALPPSPSTIFRVSEAGGKLFPQPTSNNGVFTFTPYRNLLASGKNNFEIKIFITDGDGCTSRATARLYLNVSLGVDPIPDKVMCLGDTISVSAFHEKPTATYSVNVFKWSPTDVIFDVQDAVVSGQNKKMSTAKISPKSDVVITVKNTLPSQSLNPEGCADSTSFKVTVKPAPDVAITPDTGLCGGANTSIVLKATVRPPADGGPYKFTWYNLSQSGDSTQSDTKTVSPTTTTDYSVKISSPNGCTRIDTTTVGVGQAPIVKIDSPSDNVTVCPKVNVQLKASATGGQPFKDIPNYRYEWKNVDDNVLISSLNPYDFSVEKSVKVRVQVKDSIGCSSMDSVNVLVSSFRIDGGQKDTTICENTSFVAKPVTASGSTNYTYLWESNPSLSDQTVPDPRLSPTDTLIPTKYILEVTDNFNCKLYDTVAVGVGTSPQISSIAAAIDYCEKQSYGLTANVRKGTAPFTFVWSEPSGQNIGFSSSTDASINLVPNSAGTAYKVSVRVIDANQCSSFDSTHTFNVNASPYVDFKSDTVICNGKTVLLSALFPQNAGLNLDYKWYKDGILLSNTNDNQILDAVGVYKAALTSEIGCTWADSINVLVKDSIESIDPIISGTCKGQDVKLLLNINKGTPQFNIKWGTNGLGTFDGMVDHVSNIYKDSIVYKSSEADADQIEFTIQVSNSCNVVSFMKNQALGTSPKAIISSVTPNAYINQPVDFTQNSSNYDALVWNFGDKSPVLNSNDIKVSHTYVDANIFKVVLLALNNNGCKDSTSVQVPIINNQNIYIPNVFSPTSSNPDNSNVKVYGANITNSGFSFIVFNRWGQVVYETVDFSQANKIGWNGKLQNSGDELSLGAYTYLLKGKYGDGKEFEKVGTITLVK